MTPPETAPHGKGARKREITPALVLSSYVLLSLAWIVGNPPAGAPDEWSHYLRAVSLGDGQLVGRKPPGLEGALVIVGATRPPFLDEQTYRNELAFVASTTREVKLPAGKTPGWFRCGQQNDPFVPARCFNDAPPLDETKEWFNPTSAYQPFPYLAMAAISRIDASPDTLDRLMRGGKALMSLALVAAGFFVLWSPAARLVSLVGPLVAMTPMVVFLASTLNPSGLEIMSAVAFSCAMLRLTRSDSTDPSRSCWVLAAVSGAVLSLSRTQGPAWVILILGLITMTDSTGRFFRMAVKQQRYSRPAAVALLAAAVMNRVWEYSYGARLSFDPWPLATSLAQGIAQLPAVLREHVGVFNYLEVRMPLLAYGLWGALVVALLAVALLVGTRRQRMMLLITTAAALALPVFLVATTMRHTGFGLQGRYVLGFSVLAPMLAGEILVRRYEHLRSLDAERLFLPFALGTGFVQFVAWWANARRFAVGVRGPYWFFPSAEWSPPLGWWPWAALAAGAVCLLIATGLSDIRRPEKPHDLVKL